MSRFGMLWAGLALLTPAWSQQLHVDPINRHKRVICVVPIVGTGTWEDPKRPMFAPHASEIGRDKSGILAYYYEPTDDGKSAIVVFVVTDRSVLQGTLQSVRSLPDPSVKVFERAKDSQGGG